MSDEALKSMAKDVRIEIDNYNETIQALKALSHEFTWDDEAGVLLSDVFSQIGRRMDTSPQNEICAGEQVTPDLVFQRGSDYGLIAEAKLAMCINRTGRERRIRQVVKYDDDLVGWHTDDERLDTHDIMLVVHLFRGKEIQDQLQQLQENGEIDLDRPFSLVSFGVVNRTGSEYMTLQLLSGSLSLEEKQDKLSDILAIPLDHVAGNPQFANVKLYDAKPPAPLVMDLIHNLIFENLSPDDFLELEEENELRKQVDVRELRQVISAGFGPGESGDRMPEVPRLDWIREAMSMFVKMDWAEEIDGEPDSYVYLVKRRRTPLKQFVKHFAEERLKEEKASTERSEQTSLF